MTLRTETLTCTPAAPLEPHTWDRVMVRGVKPLTCPEHRAATPKPLTPRAPKPEATPDAPQGAPDLPTPKPMSVKFKPGTLEHKNYPEALHYLKNGKHVYLFGESGTGKTHGANAMADDLGVAFHEQPCHPLMNAEDLFGFRSASGDYVPGIVRDWLENPDGGVLLLDEMDASNAALLVAINMVSALSPGKTYRFPDGTRLTRTARHVIVGAGNTNGLGGTTNYSRNSLDRATLTRFLFVNWDYDERLEQAIAGTDAIGAEWTTFCQRVRAIARRLNLPLLITQRAVIGGADLLRVGTPRKSVEASTLWQGCDDDTLRTIRQALKEEDKTEHAPEKTTTQSCCGKPMLWSTRDNDFRCYVVVESQQKDSQPV